MAESSSENSYRSILKGTSVFGGVQVFLILINLIRGKFVAMILGPEGMGISSIFSSSATTLTRASSLGLNLAIVREAAEARDNNESLSQLMAVVGRIVGLTALGGCLICVLFAGVLSRLSFGTADYAWQYVLLSVAVYLMVAGAGKLSVLQGLHEVKRVAKASLVGSLTGLFAGVPLYWFFGNKGIVPAIVVLSLATYIFYSVNLRRVVKATPVKFSWRDHSPLVKKLVGLGLILLAGDLIGSACDYLVNIYLRYFGNLDTVGLYQAANSITNQYAGAVFTAMSLDYFPRLAAHASDNRAMGAIVDRQTEIVAVIMAPIACLVITTAPIIIRLLLSSEFESIIPLMRLMGLGVVFKALQFPMGYIAFAKNNKRLFFWLEAVLTNVLYLGGIVVCYYFWGLHGLGISFVAENMLAIFIYMAVNRRAYGYMLSVRAMAQSAVGVALVVLCFAASAAVENELVSYVLMIALSVASVVYSGINIKRLIRKAN